MQRIFHNNNVRITLNMNESSRIRLRLLFDLPLGDQAIQTHQAPNTLWAYLDIGEQPRHVNEEHDDREQKHKYVQHQQRLSVHYYISNYYA